MHTRLFTLFFMCAGFARAQDTNSTNFIPVEKFSPVEKQLVATLERDASADFTAAWINLVRDAGEKRLTVYAVVPTTNGSITNNSGFTIQVIYHAELAAYYASSSGTYIAHYNNCLLTFALAQYSEGRKEFGMQLLDLLSHAEPEASWSYPDTMPIGIGTIRAGLAADATKYARILKEADEEWGQWQHDYSLPGQTAH